MAAIEARSCGLFDMIGVFRSFDEGKEAGCAFVLLPFVA